MFQIERKWATKNNHQFQIQVVDQFLMHHTLKLDGELKRNPSFYTFPSFFSSSSIFDDWEWVVNFFAKENDLCILSTKYLQWIYKNNFFTRTFSSFHQKFYIEIRKILNFFQALFFTRKELRNWHNVKIHAKNNTLKKENLALITTRVFPLFLEGAAQWAQRFLKKIRV